MGDKLVPYTIIMSSPLLDVVWIFPSDLFSHFKFELSLFDQLLTAFTESIATLNILSI